MFDTSYVYTMSGILGASLFLALVMYPVSWSRAKEELSALKITPSGLKQVWAERAPWFF